MKINHLLALFSSSEKRRLCYRRVRPSVRLSVNQFSREPWDTQNQYFQHRSVYTSPGINPNLVRFWQLSSELHGKTMYNNIFHSGLYYESYYAVLGCTTAVLRVACSHTHTLAYGSDVNELGHTVWSRGCQHLATVTRRAGYYISSPIAYKLRA